MRIARLIIEEHLHALRQPGALALVAWLTVAAYGSLVVGPLREEIAETEAQLASETLATQTAKGRREAAGAEKAPASDPLADFHKTLPRLEEASAALDRLYAAAAQAGLRLARGEYVLDALDAANIPHAERSPARPSAEAPLASPAAPTVTPAGPAGLVRYRIALPVRGGYPQIRQFLELAHRALPSLAVEAVSLQRHRIDDSEIEARLSLILYLATP
jgi:hypothetical protein